MSTVYKEARHRCASVVMNIGMMKVQYSMTFSKSFLWPYEQSAHT